MWEALTVQQLGLATKALLMLVLVTLFGMWADHRRKMARMLRLPGPRPLPFLGNLTHLLSGGIKITNAIRRMAQKYDGFVCLWLGSSPMVLITSPEHLKTFYTSSTMLDRSDQYRFTHDFFGPSLFVVGGAQWKKLRKIIMVHFVNSTPMETLRMNFMEGANQLLEFFKNNADGPTFKCHKILTHVTANNIFRNSIGEKLSDEEAPHLLHAIDYLMRKVFLRNFSILERYDFIFNRTSEGRKFWRESRYFDQIAKRIVLKKQEELKAMKERGEAVPNLYIYNLLENHGNESLELLAGEFKTLVVTGLDTTANTMGFTLVMLAMFPEVQERVYQEDQEVQKRLQGREVGVDDLQYYPYLERVFKETLRLFPVAPGIARKVNTDTSFGKHVVPAGTNVLALQIFTNHMAHIFQDPYKFDPDRFLPENIKNLPPYAFNPFSAGYRICPGMRYAYMAMKVTLAAVVRQYHIKTEYTSIKHVMKHIDTTFTIKDRMGFPISLVTR